MRHGEDLVAKDLITGKSDPYVKFKCAGQKVRRRAKMHMHAHDALLLCMCIVLSDHSRCVRYLQGKDRPIVRQTGRLIDPPVR